MDNNVKFMSDLKEFLKIINLEIVTLVQKLAVKVSPIHNRNRKNRNYAVSFAQERKRLGFVLRASVEKFAFYELRMYSKIKLSWEF